MSTRLPKWIKIGPVWYDVKRHKMVLGKNTWGAISIADAIIRIKGLVSPRHQAVTLMHEIVHGLLWSVGRNDLACEESFVEPFSEALIDTLWHTPGLLRYFKEVGKR